MTKLSEEAPAPEALSSRRSMSRGNFLTCLARLLGLVAVGVPSYILTGRARDACFIGRGSLCRACPGSGTCTLQTTETAQSPSQAGHP